MLRKVRTDDELFRVHGVDALQHQAYVENYGKANAAAAKAAALDPRWEQLHRGMSAYNTYTANKVGNPNDVDKWFEDIRLGCERVRALAGS